MNLELLKKLVKLANNNPNENEANSAARRVCKLIEKAEFKFVAEIKQDYNPFIQVQTSGANSWTSYAESYNQSIEKKCPKCGAYTTSVFGANFCHNCSRFI